MFERAARDPLIYKRVEGPLVGTGDHERLLGSFFTTTIRHCERWPIPPLGPRKLERGTKRGERRIVDSSRLALFRPYQDRRGSRLVENGQIE